MKHTVFNENFVDIIKQPMFFGESLNISRNDIHKYKKFYDLFLDQVEFYWIPEEIKLDRSISDWQKLDPKQKRVFEKNLAYQSMLDSVQTRSIGTILMPFASLPELEQCLFAQAYYETIHSRSYQHILKGLFNDPKIIFDSVILDEKIKNRAIGIIKKYNEFAEYSDFYKVLGFGKHNINGEIINITEYELKRKFYMFLINSYFLESILFYVSFVCSWIFSENGMMVEVGSIISLIARDENLHTGINANILKYYRDREGDEVMLRVMEDVNSSGEVMELFNLLIESEENWIDYLFEEDPKFLGLNSEILKSYLYYLGFNRMKNIGFKVQDLIAYKNNPLNWTRKYLNLDEVQTMLQETENINYSSSSIVDLSKIDFQKHMLLRRN